MSLIGIVVKLVGFWQKMLVLSFFKNFLVNYFI